MAVRVLIVDDSMTGRKMMKKALPPAIAGDVTEAGSGEEALRICATQTVDLMFLDLTMPGMTGFDVLEALQKETSRPVVIVVSGDVQAPAQQRVKELGASAFIRKPATAPVIEEALKRTGFL
jgi:CheY-like chemotaxis protein